MQRNFQFFQEAVGNLSGYFSFPGQSGFVLRAASWGKIPPISGAILRCSTCGYLVGKNNLRTDDSHFDDTFAEISAQQFATFAIRLLLSSIPSTTHVLRRHIRFLKSHFASGRDLGRISRQNASHPEEQPVRSSSNRQQRESVTRKKCPPESTG